MRRFIISALVLSAVTVNAQVKNGMVGINTDEPRATMHIEPGVSESKGLIIPRITADQMKTMTNLAHFGADHHAIITYLKEDLPVADRTGKLEKVDEAGYYFYNHTAAKWQKFGGGGAEQDLRMVGSNNHLTKDAGVGSNGTSLGSGMNNIGIGSQSFSGFANNSDLTGTSNTGIGSSVFDFVTGGTMSSSSNVGIGTGLYTFSLGGNLVGGWNIGLGSGIYTFNRANTQFFGSSNIGIGKSVFQLTSGNLIGATNIGVGSSIYTLYSGNMEGGFNIGIGTNAYFMRKGSIANSANNNIALGRDIYYFTSMSTSTFSGEDNIGIGHSIYTFPSGNLTGKRNIGMGYKPFSIFAGNFSGNDNIGIGTNTMRAGGGIIGGNNIALGNEAMSTGGKIAGTDNIAIGYRAIWPTANNDIGSYNIGIGNWALNGGMGRGNANIQIGNWDVGPLVPGQLNRVVAIGNEMTGLTTSNTDNNVILLGRNSLNGARVGVGTYQPKARLDVAGSIKVGNDGNTCTSDNVGTIRFVAPHFYGCDGSTWKQLDN